MTKQIQTVGEVKLTLEQAKILKVMIEWDYAWFGYNELSLQTDIPEPQLKKMMKEMSALGWVEYIKGLLNDDGEVAGSGWFVKYPFEYHLRDALRAYPYKRKDKMTKQIQTVELPDNLIDDLENVWIAHRDISGTYDFDDMMVNLELSIKKSLAQAQLVKQDMLAVLPKNQCTQCGAWVSDELKDDHICAAGEKKKTVFPEIIEGKDPDLIWRDGGTYVGVINRGDTIVMYTWDGIAESWITRNVFDRVDLFVKEF